MSTPKYQRELARKLKPLGWWIRRKMTGSAHLIVTDGEHQLTASLSPKNPDHAIKNVIKDIRRYYRNKR